MLVEWGIMDTKVLLGEICLKPVYFEGDFEAHASSKLGQGDEAPAVLQPAHLCQPAAAICLGGSKGIKHSLLWGGVVWGRLILYPRAS